MIYETSSEQGKSFSQSNWSSSIASSKDLIHWTKLGQPVLPVIKGGFRNDGPAWFTDVSRQHQVYFRNKDNVSQRAMLKEGEEAGGK